MRVTQDGDHNVDADAPLVARAQRGDAVAFGQLVRRHHASVHRAACAILGSTFDAEDVVQEAWLHAYLRLAQFQETSTFSTWVHAIVRHRAIDQHRLTRRRRWHGPYAVALSADAEFLSCAPTPEERLLDAERDARLAAAVAALPVQLRATLELWQTGDYSYEDMARIAGVRKSAIKSRMWKARRHVTHALCASVLTSCQRGTLAGSLKDLCVGAHREGCSGGDGALVDRRHQ